MLTMEKYRIAIFASGNGTNAEAIMNHFNDHHQIEVAALLSNSSNAYALQRATNHGIAAFTFTREDFINSTRVVELLKTHTITHVVLAGFMWLIPASLITAFPHKIINIHPALLPKYGGKGMYGMHVHEAVKRMNDVESGITIHEVNDRYDEGKAIFQAACALESTDTPDTIADKVHTLEHKYYPQVIERWILAELTS